jgi:hypothetical protein
MFRAWQLLPVLLATACVNLSTPSAQLQPDGSLPDAASDLTDRPDQQPADALTDAPAEATDADEEGGSPDLHEGLDADGDEMPPTDTTAVNGTPCAFDSHCQSEICSDGVCCDARCGGVCQACNLEGSTGTCSPVPAGGDPANECAQDPPATCARDGSCDGQGTCRRYPAGTECAAGRCEGATEYAASTCDGSGACNPGASTSCAPNSCREDACASACVGDTDCQTGFFCENSACKLKRSSGTACTSGGQCATGFCVDDVCCASACAGTCSACNLSGAPGTCTPIPGGQDPGGECPAEGPQTCGRAGGCNGAGACRLHPDGTTCAAQTCNGSTETGVSRCNGGGACVRPASRDCGAYLCSGISCGTSCSAASQCRSGNVCAGSSCVSCAPESNGAFCLRLGKSCGQVSGTDNCGSARTVSSCGSCSSPQTCGGGGTANVCGGGTPCVSAYAQSSCVGYTPGTRVSSGGHNWTCSNGNCANCAGHTGCAPGGTGCPWGTVWTDDGACR